MDVAHEEKSKTRIAMLAASHRIDKDKLGYSLACGEHISPRRLEIDPIVTLCVDYQR